MPTDPVRCTAYTSLASVTLVVKKDSNNTVLFYIPGQIGGASVSTNFSLSSKESPPWYLGFYANASATKYACKVYCNNINFGVRELSQNYLGAI